MTRSNHSKRAAERAAWPIRRITLDAEGDSSTDAPASAEERFAMVWRLTRDAWALSGRPMPDYPRAEAPGRLRRLDEEETDGREP